MKPFVSLLSVLALCLVAAMPLAQEIAEGDLLVADDFARFDGSATELGETPAGAKPWHKRIPARDGAPMEQIVRGVNGEMMVGYSSGSNPHDTGVAVSEFTIADASISLTVGPSSMASRTHLAFINYRARTLGSAAGGKQPDAYHVEIGGDWSGSRDVRLLYGGQSLAAADIADSRSPQDIHHVRVAFAGAHHTVWVEGEKVIDYWEYAPGRESAGHVGFGGYYSIGTFDDFELRAASLGDAELVPVREDGRMLPLMFQGRPFFVLGSFDQPRTDEEAREWLDAGFNTALFAVMREGVAEEDNRATLQTAADWAAKYEVAAVYYPCLNPYSKDGDQPTVTKPEDIPAKAAILTQMLSVTSEHPQTLGYWTFDEPENHVYKAYAQWDQRKDKGLAEWMAEGLQWTYETLKAGDPDAYVMPTIAWWTTYEGLAPLYDVNVPNTYPCGEDEAPLQADLFEVVYDAALAADAVRATGRHSFVFMPPMFDVINGGRAASRRELLYCCLAPVTQGSMGVLGWRLGRCSQLYRQMVIYPVMRDVSRLVPWLLGDWQDEKVSSDHDTPTAEYLKKFPVRIRLVPGEEDAEEIEVPGVPDCSYALRRRPDNTYLLLAVSNRKEPMTVTFTLKDIPGLPGTAFDYLDYARIPIVDGRITDSFRPFGVRAYIIEPK